MIWDSYSLLQNRPEWFNNIEMKEMGMPVKMFDNIVMFFKLRIVRLGRINSIPIVLKNWIFNWKQCLFHFEALVAKIFKMSFPDTFSIKGDDRACKKPQDR
ncbi:hypothetical protein AVEN_166897-1 [Araneus ventricosus]|uniref:Uncharacterized protein n=1 Tax=Araneus ventricosus TaxID=182803 RepID=A0A4Y2W6G4_ARAVE|nr:hypothetical protein AVEN_166897-1 [Araneus ventricosus]